MRRFFTSDLHFNHTKVAQLRGFTSVTDHNNWIIAEYNKVVNSSDMVFILGDITIGNWANALNLASLLNGHKHLISGNHDGTWPLNKGWHNKIKPTLEVFESVSTWAQTSIAGEKFLMSHLPYKEDHLNDDRYMNVRLQSDMPLLCGHVHDKWTTNGKMINVGVDRWKRPVSEQEIEQILNQWR